MQLPLCSVRPNPERNPNFSRSQWDLTESGVQTELKVTSNTLIFCSWSRVMHAEIDLIVCFQFHDIHSHAFLHKFFLYVMVPKRAAQVSSDDLWPHANGCDVDTEWVFSCHRTTRRCSVVSQCSVFSVCCSDICVFLNVTRSKWMRNEKSCVVCVCRCVCGWVGVWGRERGEEVSNTWHVSVHPFKEE